MLRVKGGTLADAAAMVRENGSAVVLPKRKANHAGYIGGNVRMAPATRVRVNRTDMGGRHNARLAATAGELAPHGAHNTVNTARERDAATGERYIAPPDRTIDGNAWTFDRSEYDRLIHPVREA